MRKVNYHFDELDRSGIINKKKAMIKTENNIFCDDLSCKSNLSFDLSFFYPDSSLDKEYNSAIIMLHGLNERSQDKYLPWISYIVDKCRVPVIFFPIAMHINRSQTDWLNSRLVYKYMTEDPQIDLNKSHRENSLNSSIFNYVISKRLREDPFRFYIYGRETISNVNQLTTDLKLGMYNGISANADIHFFSYSIGALLTQVMLMADDKGLYDRSQIAIFCGGSVLSRMDGNSRLILDKCASDLLKQYYLNDFFGDQELSRKFWDNTEECFIAHISRDFYSLQRYEFYNKISDRLKIVHLSKDRVINRCGIVEAVGCDVASKVLYEFDFDQKYSHESPFPDMQNSDNDKNVAYNANFSAIFDLICDSYTK